MGGLLLGHVGLPGRVRLRRPAVPAGPRAAHDRRRRGHRAGRRPAVHGPRRRAGRRRLLPGHPGRHRADRRARCSARSRRRSRSTSARRSSSNCSRSSVPLVRRPLVFGAVAGVAIGTLGHLTEFGWTQLVQTLSWGSDIARRGHAHGDRRRRGRRPARRAAGRRACGAGCPAPPSPGPCWSAAWSCWPPPSPTACWPPCPTTSTPRSGSRTSQADPRTANITVQLDPADFVDDPSWVQITSWQGDGPGRHAAGADRRGRLPDDASRCRCTATWKTLLRIHDGRTLTAMPIYLPADEAIGRGRDPGRGRHDPLGRSPRSRSCSAS